MACDACGDKPKNESKYFPKAVVEINNPESLVLLRKVVIPASMGDDTEFPPIVGKYYNVLLHYDANGRNYLYSSDGIPTLLETTIPDEIYERIETLETGLAQEILDRQNGDSTLDNKITTLDNSLATVAKTGSYTDLINKPTIGDGTLTIQKNSTNVGTFNANATTNSTINLEIPIVDTTMSISSNNAIANSTISNKLNKNVMTDISLNANTSTTTVQIDGAKENIYTGATSTKNIALPVASTTQAGVMNSSTYDAVTSNTNNINAIMNGAVAITGISANPSQSDLTTAWQTETGLTTLINRASIYDVTNNKVWTYYTNDATWHAASNSSQVTINTFTNNSEGTILGSTNVGQIFAENDGTGSVNGWDNLSNAVSTNTSNITALQNAMPTVNDATLTIQNNGTNVATFTANSATNTTANIVSPVDIGSVLSTPSDVAYVNSNNIISNAVTTGKIANGAVTADKIDFTTLMGGNAPIVASTMHLPYFATGDVMNLWRIGNLVFAYSNVVTTSLGTYDSIVVAETMPSGFRPATGTMGMFILNSVVGTSSTVGMTISPNGSVAFSNRSTISTSTRFYGCGCWITKDNWPN